MAPDVRRLAGTRAKVQGRPLPKSWRAGLVGKFDARDLSDGMMDLPCDPDVQLEPTPRDLSDQAVRDRVSRELHRRGLVKAWRRLDTCGEVLGVRVCTKCGSRQVHANRCGQWRLCPTCARVHSRKVARRLERLRGQVPSRPGYRWRLLTLPVKTDGQYRRALRVAVDGFSRLWARHLKRLGAGAYRTVEFGELRGNAHAHVLYYGPWVDQRDLSRWWEAETGSYVVDVRQVGKRGDFAGAVAEVCKYICKMSSAPPDRAVDLFVAMKGSRMAQAYGVLFGRGLESEAVEVEPCACGCTAWVYIYGLPDQPRGPPHN